MKKRLFCNVTLIVFILAVFMSCGQKGTNDEEAWLLYGKASAAYSKGRFEESAELLEKARSFPPAQALRAKSLYFCNRVEEAERLLRGVLRRNRGAAEAAIFLARILREQGKDEEAQQLAEALLRDNPQDIRALRLASDLAGQRGDAENAAALLDRAAEASAETALVFVDRAKLRWNAGNGTGALEDLRRAELLLPWNTSLGRGIRDLRTVIGDKSQ